MGSVAGATEGLARKSDATKPFAGKTVAVVHAAWHSCGSYQVNVSQLIAYKALGARVISIAFMDVPGPPAPDGGRWPRYLEGSRDLPADRRFFTGASNSALWTISLLKDGWWPLIHGDQATWLIELAKRAPMPEGVETETIDLVHANHYFTLPFVERLIAKRRVPIILETHDIQARQFVLRNQDGFFIPPYVIYEDMLAVEVGWMKRADVNVHINAEEHAAFLRLLPGARHELVYPAVAPAPLGAGGRAIVIVASNHYPNYLGLRWFLEKVLPLAPGVDIEIYGNIDEGVRSRDAALYEAHQRLFKGRAPDIGTVYANAGCVLLPTTDGYGLSIKAVEALSSGAPLITTPAAFRGMSVDPRTLANVAVAERAEDFAAALRDIHARLQAGGAESSRATTDSRRYYDEAFSNDAYARALAKITVPMVCG